MRFDESISKVFNELMSNDMNNDLKQALVNYGFKNVDTNERGNIQASKPGETFNSALEGINGHIEVYEYQGDLYGYGWFDNLSAEEIDKPEIKLGGDGDLLTFADELSSFLDEISDKAVDKALYGD